MRIIRVIKRLKANQGFTMAELMIATSVFSVLLLLSLAGFLQIGQLFYKGVNITRTSNSAKQAISSLKNDITFDASGVSIIRNGPVRVTAVINGVPTNIDRYWFCAGPNRYTFIYGRQLDIDAETQEIKSPTTSQFWARFALLKDKVTTGCPTPFSPTGDLIDPNNVTELLGDKMRLSDLTITPLPSPNDKLYTIRIKLVYGDDSVLQNPNQPTAKCLSGAVYARYCFVTELKTTVRQGLAP